jgi:hypothetical protein
MTQSSDDVIKAIGGIMSAQTGLGQIAGGLTNKVTKPLLEMGKSALDAAIANESMEATFNSVFKTTAQNMRSWSQSVSDNMSLSEYKLRSYASNLRSCSTAWMWAAARPTTWCASSRCAPTTWRR